MARFLEASRLWPSSDHPRIEAAARVIADLARQGWTLRVRAGEIKALPPPTDALDRGGEKERVRRQELLKRDEQLLQPAVRKFIDQTERPRPVRGELVSIFSLMRDGRELADKLANARSLDGTQREDALKAAVDPYLEFVTSEGRCAFTGIPLQDVWRYFRHTWTNQYTSVPGRTMQFLVRDRAARFHPVIGIGALSSPIVQIDERDRWIGWHREVFLTKLEQSPSAEYAEWLVRTVDTAIGEIYLDDLLRDEVLTADALRQPNQALLERLVKESADQRRRHHRHVQAQEFKTSAVETDGSPWRARARTHLFRSKRCLGLAELLRARMVLRAHLGVNPTSDGLRALLGDPAGRDVIARVLRKAKADRVGIAMADLTVCGAVPPYNAILGGKLVCMLAVCPDVVAEYRRRYGHAQSEIASATAGRPIVRPAQLVFVGTTSLYGVGSSQYNRVRIPADRLGGCPGDEIRFLELGKSESFGTSQFSADTVGALVRLVQQSKNGQRVNSIFGEGVSPKLRKVREGLAELNLPAGRLLQHGRSRIVYGVPLARNAGRFLIGLDDEPAWIVSPENHHAREHVAAWWRQRWLWKRIERADVLVQVRLHTLSRPIRHGARVRLPVSDDGELALFDDPWSGSE